MAQSQLHMGLTPICICGNKKPPSAHQQNNSNNTAPLVAGAAGRLAPRNNGSAQADAQATRGIPKQPPDAPLREVPGPDRRAGVFFQKPGDIPSLGDNPKPNQKLGTVAMHLIHLLHGIQKVAGNFGRGAQDAIPPVSIPKALWDPSAGICSKCSG